MHVDAQPWRWSQGHRTHQRHSPRALIDRTLRGQAWRISTRGAKRRESVSLVVHVLKHATKRKILSRLLLILATTIFHPLNSSHFVNTHYIYSNSKDKNSMPSIMAPGFASHENVTKIIQWVGPSVSLSVVKQWNTCSWLQRGFEV